MKYKWMHVEFYFRAPDAQHRTSCYFNAVTLIVFKKLLDGIVGALGANVRRRFFLFEPRPHCFLALEVDEETVKLVAKLLKRKFPSWLKESKFIKSIKINLESHDETNGEAFLNLMNGAYEVIMQKDKKFCPPWLRNHPKEKQVLIHAVHCLLNSFTCSRPEEIRFYLMMAETYSVGYRK